MANELIIIRPYKKEDREVLRKIVCDTAFMGKSSTIFFDGEEVLADSLSLYYTDFEPQSCFVAVLENKVVGYIFGAKDTKVYDKTFFLKIFPKLLAKSFISGVLLKKKNLILLRNFFVSFLKGEFILPDVYKRLPATLHINIKDGYRALGIGGKLIKVFLEYLKKEGVKGVRFATMSDKASEFFLKQGFSLIYKNKRSYFNHLNEKDVFVYLFGKELI